MERTIIGDSGAPRPLAHYCEGVVVGDHVYAAGQIASDYETGIPAEARTDAAFPYYGSDIQLQTRYVLSNLQKTFAAAGDSLENVVKSQVFLVDLDDFFHFDQVWQEFFPSPPPRTTVQVGALLVPGCRVEIDLVAVKRSVPRAIIGESGNSGAPRPLAHYCEGVVVGEHIYAAGQIASDYETGIPAEARTDPAFPYYGSDIQRQTRYVLENLRKTFAAAGASLENVVKSQVFLTDLDDFFYFDQVWREFFPSPPPRTTVQVGALLVPGCRVEIDLVAVKGSVPRAIIGDSGAPRPLAHYCEGVVVGDHIYAAGQIASDYRTGIPAEARTDAAFPYYGSDIQRQTRYVLENLRKTFAAAGAGLEDVVKSQVFLTDLDDFYYFDQIWREFFPSPPPRTTVQVGALLVPGCRVEIDLVAVRR